MTHNNPIGQQWKCQGIGLWTIQRRTVPAPTRTGVCYSMLHFFEAGQDLYHESICDAWGKRSGMFGPQGFPVFGRRPQLVRRLPFQHGHAAGHELATTSLISRRFHCMVFDHCECFLILFLWCVYGKQGPEYRDHDMFIPIFRGCGVRDDWWYIWSGSHCDVAVDVQYMSSIGQLSPSDLMIFRLVNSYSLSRTAGALKKQQKVYSIGFHPHEMGCWLVNPRLCSIVQICGIYPSHFFCFKWRSPFTHEQWSPAGIHSDPWQVTPHLLSRKRDPYPATGCQQCVPWSAHVVECNGRYLQIVTSYNLALLKQILFSHW